MDDWKVQYIQRCVEAFKILGDVSRLHILLRLKEEKMSWSELLENQPNKMRLYRNLKLLCEQGIIEKKGSNYALTEGGKALLSLSPDQYAEAMKIITPTS